jgi:transposase
LGGRARVRASPRSRALGGDDKPVRLWVKRVNGRGVAGLADAPRSGRPAISPPSVIGEVVAASLTKPDDLGLDFRGWTLDRLTAYLPETTGVGIGRTRVGAILRTEGLRWQQEETWFGERVDPDFVTKRGRSSFSTTRHRRMVS